MSQKERIKLEIDILKALILAFLTAIFGIFSYALINYANINLLQGIGGFIGLIIIFIALYFVVKRIIKNLKQIEELE